MQLRADVSSNVDLVAVGQKLNREVRQTIGVLTLRLEAKIKRDKLTGQVLKVRSGLLRNSISSKVEDVGGGIVGTVGAGGALVHYAKVHEFGFNGQANVRQHLRMQKTAWGRPVTPRQVTVSSFTRAMNLPERSFLRSALSDMRPEIITELQRAVERGVNAT